MGAVFENLTQEQLCDLICGIPDEEDRTWDEEEAKAAEQH